MFKANPTIWIQLNKLKNLTMNHLQHYIKLIVRNIDDGYYQKDFVNIVIIYY